jgi:hypothetical protein
VTVVRRLLALGRPVTPPQTQRGLLRDKISGQTHCEAAARARERPGLPGLS